MKDGTSPSPKSANPLKEFGLNIIVFILSTALFLGLAEGGFRAYEFYTQHIRFVSSASRHLHPKFGWKGKWAYREHPGSPMNFLVVGDSFTDGEGVREDAIYYRVIEEKLGGSLFAYGGSGYGSLQEYLVVDEYIDKVKPTLILWQVDANDFYNNSWKFESAFCMGKGNTLRRPYFINGKIEYRYPRFLGILGIHSRLFYRLSLEVERSLMLVCSKLPQNPEREKTLLEESKQITEQIARMMKERAGPVPVVAFLSSGSGVYPDDFREIFKNSGIDFIDGVPEAVREAERVRGRDLSLGPKIGHWNEEGSRVVGEFLLAELARLGHLPAEPPAPAPAPAVTGEQPSAAS